MAFPPPGHDLPQEAKDRISSIFHYFEKSSEAGVNFKDARVRLEATQPEDPDVFPADMNACVQLALKTPVQRQPGASEPATKRARVAATITKAAAKAAYLLTDSDLKKLTNEKVGRNVVYDVEDVKACAYRKHGGSRSTLALIPLTHSTDLGSGLGFDSSHSSHTQY